MRDTETREQCQARRKVEDARPEMVEMYRTKLAEAIDLALAQIGVPIHALGVARDCQPTAAVKVVDEVGGHGMMILSGGIGCGKTVAAAKWVLDYTSARENWKVDRTCNLDDETNGYRYSFRGNAVWVSSAKLARVDHYDASVIAGFANCDRLVIDDLGVEYMDPKGFYLSYINELLNERYDAELATLMTTNCNASDFTERYKGRIVSRVKETGRFFGCGGEDLRKPAAAEQQLQLGGK